MDAAGAIGSVVSAVVESGKLICRLIYPHANNFFLLQLNLNSLQIETATLCEMKEYVLSELDSAERDGNLPTPQVKLWLRDVEKVLSVAEQMQLGITASNLGVSGCIFNFRLSIKVSKTLKEVERLTGADYPTQIVATYGQVRMVEYVPGSTIEDQTAASRNLAKLMDQLNQDGVGRVGIWGMGGVGKTTLVKNLNNKLESSTSTQPFGKVIWTTVSKEMSLKRVQAQIAGSLDLSMRERDEERMAIRLHQRLKKEKFLLILDDVWEHIDLNDLGIPKPEDCMGCKILFTSRSREICSQMMMDTGFKVDVLLDEEAGQLFEKHAGEVVNLEQVVPFAQEIVRECGGLPLAIITMGAAMRGKENIVLWKDALNAMRRSLPPTPDIEKKVFNSLKWSYDSLQDGDIKSMFLYCCLYPEDFSIEIKELVECWMREGVIDGSNYEDAVNHGIALVEKLKDACLLESGRKTPLYDLETVKMHDIIRDVAIWIASVEGGDCESLVKSGTGLTEVSNLKFSKSLKRVSFVNNKLERLPSETVQIECSQVCTLFLQGNSSLPKIPEVFLQQFQALKVLNVSRTGIRDLPIGLGSLVMLRKLDLSYTSSLKSIPVGVMCRLSCLEILDMEWSAYEWVVNEVVEDGQASLEELGCLHKLIKLIIIVGTRSIAHLNSCDLNWICRLTTFKFLIGTYYMDTYYDRLVRVQGIDVSQSRMEGLLTYTTSLLMYYCTGLDMMLEKLSVNRNASFSGLKVLEIKFCDISIEQGSYSGIRETSSRFDLLPNLEELKLEELKIMDSISEFLIDRLRLELSKLRSLKVKKCTMKHLFIVGGGAINQVLGNLEEIDLEKCSNLEEMFQYAGVSTGDRLNLQQVDDNLVFKMLPKIQKVVVSECPRLRKLPLSKMQTPKLPRSRNVSANTMVEIRGTRSWWDKLEWDDVVTKDSLNHLFQEI